MTMHDTHTKLNTDTKLHQLKIILDMKVCSTTRDDMTRCRLSTFYDQVTQDKVRNACAQLSVPNWVAHFIAQGETLFDN